MSNIEAKIILIILFLFSVVNCKTKISEPEIVNNSNTLKRVWMLIEFQDFKKEDLIKVNAQMNLTDFKNPNASMGCNRIGFKIEVKNEKIKFNDIIVTEMFCAEKMKLENEFSKTLNQSFKYYIKGHNLTLLNPKNKKIVFVAQDWD